jgi:hypothetical protein
VLGKMAEGMVITTTIGIARHSATRLPSVDVDDHNELLDDVGFLGDRASRRALRKIWRAYASR